MQGLLDYERPCGGDRIGRQIVPPCICVAGCFVLKHPATQESSPILALSQWPGYSPTPARLTGHPGRVDGDGSLHSVDRESPHHSETEGHRLLRKRASGVVCARSVAPLLRVRMLGARNSGTHPQAVGRRSTLTWDGGNAGRKIRLCVCS